MNTCSWLATVLDQEMLESHSGATIASRLTPEADLTPRNGSDVATELGGRYLIRYVMPHQVGDYRNGSTDRHYVTPTPYPSDESISWLYLPRPMLIRTHALLVNPERVNVILGPRWIRIGKGIEYILPEGFPQDAIVMGWEIQIT